MYHEMVNAGELHRLARALRDIALAATANPGERAVPAASTVAVVEDVSAHPGTSITHIAERTGLAQSLVSGTVARLAQTETFLVERDTADRRRTLVTMNPTTRTEDFAERAARGIDDAIHDAAPHLTATQIAQVGAALDQLADALRTTTPSSDTVT